MEGAETFSQSDFCQRSQWPGLRGRPLTSTSPCGQAMGRWAASSAQSGSVAEQNSHWNVSSWDITATTKGGRECGDQSFLSVHPLLHL